MKTGKRKLKYEEEESENTARWRKGINDKKANYEQEDRTKFNVKNTMDTRTTKQKERKVEGQEGKMMQMLMKLMQQNNEIQIQNRAIVERLDENSRIIQQMQQNIYEIKQDLEATNEDFRMEIKQNKEETQSQLQKFLEEMNENWGKKYIEFDSKILEVKEQASNNSRRIDEICKGVAEQKNKLADVEAKMNKNREEKNPSLRIFERSE
ncbi:hypothetical protein FQA39_LY02993 [Lamprigera yunnana]|nr:hypothetical protein FQA39_LY02993 [Lamprigera yunnana]